MSEKQKKNWASVKDIKKVITILRKEIHYKKLFIKDKLNKKEIDLIQQYLLVVLYNDNQVRNTYSVKKIQSTKYNKMKLSEKKEHNWLVIGRTKRFEFWKIKSNYKGELPIIYKINNRTLSAIINKWNKINTSDNFLINQKGNRLSENMITKTLQKIFKRILNKSISTSLLRHIYISEKLKNTPTIREKEELANNMHHSTRTQDQYRKIL